MCQASRKILDRLSVSVSFEPSFSNANSIFYHLWLAETITSHTLHAVVEWRGSTLPSRVLSLHPISELVGPLLGGVLREKLDFTETTTVSCELCSSIVLYLCVCVYAFFLHHFEDFWWCACCSGEH